MSDIRTVEKYCLLENQRSELEDQLAAVKAKTDEIREGVLKYFEAHGIDRITKEGRTLSVRRELWAAREEGVTPDEGIEALRAAGLDEFCEPRINTQSLSAFMRELDRDGKELPAALRGVFRVAEQFKIGSRRS